MTARKSSVGMLRTVCGSSFAVPGRRGLATPAAATRTSTAPSVSTQRRTIASFAASSVVFTSSASERRPAPITPRVVSSARFRSRSATQTCAPSSANLSAQARPMPLPPPVISATFPSRRPGIWFAPFRVVG